MRRRIRKTNGLAYFVTSEEIQVSAGLLNTHGHNTSQCAWCIAYETQKEATPCPEREQLQLFPSPQLTAAKSTPPPSPSET